MLAGHARFKSAHSIEVTANTLRADNIYINVGGRALIPNFPGIEQVPYLTNSTMMVVDFLPEHLVIIGGSYIGLDFAQVYRRFGAKVTVIEKFPQLIAREDADVSNAVLQILRNEAIVLRDCRRQQADARGRDSRCRRR